ncbi:SdpA family antimicrobial peptide system protein [Corynebacterium diphtheriae]|uniref:SdpA family antimicrobial peptide system protein n=1 Tax=Corynebacterium diphtheriae TaxID=1717 RepID=UPI000A1E230C|nr:SdpA family antimicrobial peptide system protein [Corynebacterium diphtheriae]MCM0017424.1 SdpA family antimicrobial peptide system protein [Corynebacterium diphtheriae bv. mitis]MCM0027133.1 SdpA family antimicrobial peptide system protein [Corynebacterium diphtheriae bv. mitis]MCM0046890.1 SdpA family antimicrobial peptide system protein [Corynebacterium diphtheriae bv. mitis]MCM0051434.1 SdpA family antimicrobial peptide system protein [Corynebacterium diphtheriae bv. mitis]MCM0059105.1 
MKTNRSEEIRITYRFYASFWSTLFVLTSLMLVGIFFTLPSNVLSIRDGGEARTFFASYLPQSWGFFVKPQQDGEYRVYSIDGSESASRIDSFPNSSPSNFFGLSRSQRSQGPEIAEIVQQNDWENCNSVSIHECLVEASKDPPHVSAQNSAKDKTMCGELIFLHTKPTIWSYQDFSNERRTAEAYQHVTVKCEQ